jgi:hypothetical protein
MSVSYSKLNISFCFLVFETFRDSSIGFIEDVTAYQLQHLKLALGQINDILAKERNALVYDLTRQFLSDVVRDYNTLLTINGTISPIVTPLPTVRPPLHYNPAKLNMDLAIFDLVDTNPAFLNLTESQLQDILDLILLEINSQSPTTTTLTFTTKPTTATSTRQASTTTTNAPPPLPTEDPDDPPPIERRAPGIDPKILAKAPQVLNGLAKAWTLGLQLPKVPTQRVQGPLGFRSVVVTTARFLNSESMSRDNNAAIKAFQDNVIDRLVELVAPAPLPFSQAEKDAAMKVVSPAFEFVLNKISSIDLGREGDNDDLVGVVRDLGQGLVKVGQNPRQPFFEAYNDKYITNSLDLGMSVFEVADKIHFENTGETASSEQALYDNALKDVTTGRLQLEPRPPNLQRLVRLAKLRLSALSKAKPAAPQLGRLSEVIASASSKSGAAGASHPLIRDLVIESDRTALVSRNTERIAELAYQNELDVVVNDDGYAMDADFLESNPDLVERLVNHPDPSVREAATDSCRNIMGAILYEDPSRVNEYSKNAKRYATAMKRSLAATRLNRVAERLDSHVGGSKESATSTLRARAANNKFTGGRISK